MVGSREPFELRRSSFFQLILFFSKYSETAETAETALYLYPEGGTN